MRRIQARAVLAVLAFIAPLVLMAPTMTPIFFLAARIVVGAGNTLRIQAAPSSKVAIPIVVDMSQAAGNNVAQLTTGVSWATARLTFDSLKPGNFGTLVAGTGSAPSGSVSLNISNPTGTTASFTVATLYFTASASTGTTNVQTTPTSATAEAGSNLNLLLAPRPLDVCIIAAAGRWGDVNNDGVANIIDAQQIARYSVGLSVANLAAVQAAGDVNADGNVNIIDAQQVARFSVGLSASARVNTTFGGAPPTVASVAVAPTSANLTGPGQTVQLAATPKDGTNSSIAGCVPVTWSSLNAAVATVDSTGFVVAVANGATTIRATAGAQTFDVGVNVGTPTAASVTVVLANPSVSGNAITTATATVRDQFNNPIAGAPVVWSVGNPLVARVTAGGSVQALGAGTAAIVATSGSVSGFAMLTAASAPAGFNIVVRIIGSMTASQQAGFTTAANKWMSVLRGGVSDFAASNLDLTGCGIPGVTLNETVHHIIVYAQIDSIDGPGNILGSAGPCYLRGGGAPFPIVGLIHLDVADVAGLEADGRYLGVVEHEMGHVLGFGTIWTNLGLLTDAGTADPIFTGTNAVWTFPALGFSSYPGRFVPVENTGGAGTRDAHWRESVLDRELMTSFVENPGEPMPLTALTVGQFLDLGYIVDYSQADAMSFGAAAAAAQAHATNKLLLIEGRMPPPIVVDASGRPIGPVRKPPGAP